MIDTVEELSKKKKVYVLNETLTQPNVLYAVYNVTKSEYRGINKYYVQLKTNSLMKEFPSTLNIVGLRIQFNYNSKLKVFETYNDMMKYFCSAVKQDPINKTLVKKLTQSHPQYFI